MHTTKQIKAARTLCAKLAASADPARNDNEAERAVALAKLIAKCAEFGFELAEFGVKPVASPEAEAASDDVAARAAANRAFTARHYSGPSQASHSRREPKLAEALARVADPIQRAKACSVRDESGLLLAASKADAAGTFCPLSGTFDLGVLSRLASLGFLTVAGDRIAISKAGRDLAANLARKAA
jgi:hypothetical protein